MSDIIYGIDAKKNLMTVSENKSFAVGATATVDGIEVYCIRAGIANVSLNEMSAVDSTPPIFVDKNHDLSYYVKGSDYVDSNDYNQSPGTYGYEWGGYNITTSITNTAVGTGLSNTNALIWMNLQPYEEGWWVVWDKVMDFRSSYGHNWFVPSKDELNLVYENRANLNNLSLNTNSSYWSSSEFSSSDAWRQHFGSGGQNFTIKAHRFSRVRLCYMPQ